MTKGKPPHRYAHLPIPHLLLVLTAGVFITGLLLGATLELARQKPQVSIAQSLNQTTQELPNPELSFTPLPLTLETVFSPDHSWTTTLSAQKKTTLIAVGDILLARTVNSKTVSQNNFHWPFEKTADLLRSANLTIGNLETPLIENCPLTTTGMIFCGDLRNTQSLQFTGIDAVSLANNHAENYALEGVNTTQTALTQSGITPFGLHRPVYVNANGLTIALLGYNAVNPVTTVASANPEIIAQDIKRAKQTADIVIPYFHWGNEYTTVVSQLQTELAHTAIDAGADIVLGAHPHWIQPIELYKGRPIIYSHGNFIFDQMWSQKTREGLITKFTFYDGKLADLELIPVIIEDFGQPRVASEIERAKLLSDIVRVSQPASQVVNNN